MHNVRAPDGALSPSPAGSGTLRKALWALSIAGLIFYASSRSFVAAPGITKMDDKFGHFAVYGLLATLVCRMGQGWRAALGAVIVVSAYGASDEWHQSFVPGRSPEVEDWISDTVGAAVAVFLYSGWPWYRRRLETPVWRRRARNEAHVPGSSISRR